MTVALPLIKSTLSDGRGIANKVLDGPHQFTGLIVEEMSRARDSFELEVVPAGKVARNSSSGASGATSSSVPWMKIFGFAQRARKSRLIHSRGSRGRADGDQFVDAFVRTSHSQSDNRAERKTGDDDFARVRLAVEKIIERDLRVGAFAAPFVELARTQPDAAEVEPQCLEAAFVQSLRRAEDDLVVHRAAVQRVRMQYQRDPLGLIAFRAIDRFQPPVSRRNEKISRRIQ